MGEERYNFNRGIVSELALARLDLDRTKLSAAEQTNFIPRVFGSASLRPGLGYIGQTDSDLTARLIPFVFSSDDTAILELTNGNMRVWIDDAVLTRPSVTAAVSNGTFGSDLTGWTDADESGATSAWATGGYMSLTGSGYNRAIRTQQVTVNETGVEHALNIVVARGPVVLRVGTNSGDDNYIAETTLGTGYHSLSLTPSGNFYIHISNMKLYASLVDSITIEAAGVEEITSPWLTADLPYIRYSASADVTFVSCQGHQQYSIERRATRSWSIVKYEPEDGPFRVENVNDSLQISASGISGDITLTASNDLFKSTHVGALFSIDSVGQKVSISLNGDNQFSDPIRVTGVGNSRRFLVNITGTWSATVTLQRSVGDIGAWVDVVTYTSNVNVIYDDNLDNQIIYYRIGVDTGDYTSGTANAYLLFSGGTLTGIVRVTAYSSGTSVSARVLKSLGGTAASNIWSEGAWSDYRGWPSSVGLYEGRLWWAGKNKIYGSVSDGYYSFDDTIEGDSGTISRSIGEGPVDAVNWILPIERLVLSTASAEWGAKSSSFDEPLSPTAFNLKRVSTQGSAAVAAVAIDSEGVYVQSSGSRVYQLMFDADRYNYGSADMTALVPELGEPGIVALGVQRQPDTRVHCVRSDGKVMLLVYDKLENVRGWVMVETDGVVEDVCVLPGTDEDQVYYSVQRTLPGGSHRYIEKWAKETECRGATVSKLADSHIVYSGAATSTITGLDHLEGKSVVAWADGRAYDAETVAGGQITLPTAVSNAVVGLTYDGRYQSTKLKELALKKRVVHVTVVTAYMHASGLRFGQDFDTMDDLPLVEEHTTVDPNYVWQSYHQDPTEFPGTWDMDSRICLMASAPKPVTLMGIELETE